MYFQHCDNSFENDEYERQNPHIATGGERAGRDGRVCGSVHATPHAGPGRRAGPAVLPDRHVHVPHCVPHVHEELRRGHRALQVRGPRICAGNSVRESSGSEVQMLCIHAGDKWKLEMHKNLEGFVGFALKLRLVVPTARVSACTSTSSESTGTGVTTTDLPQQKRRVHCGNFMELTDVFLRLTQVHRVVYLRQGSGGRLHRQEHGSSVHQSCWHGERYSQGILASSLCDMCPKSKHFTCQQKETRCEKWRVPTWDLLVWSLIERLLSNDFHPACLEKLLGHKKNQRAGGSRQDSGNHLCLYGWSHSKFAPHERPSPHKWIHQSTPDSGCYRILQITLNWDAVVELPLKRKDVKTRLLFWKQKWEQKGGDEADTRMCVSHRCRTLVVVNLSVHWHHVT